MDDSDSDIDASLATSDDDTIGDNDSNLSFRREQKLGEDLEEEDNEEEEEEDDEEDDEELDEYQFQKITPQLKQNIVQQYYPELRFKKAQEMEHLVKITRDEKGNIVDELHRTTPLLTKFERTRILGERAKQLQQGAKPFIPGMEEVVDSYAIAEEELKQKLLPFIIERPLPFGECEYWQLADLEVL